MCVCVHLTSTFDLTLLSCEILDSLKAIIHGATLLHATCCTKLNGCQLGATCCMQQNRISYTVQHVACNVLHATMLHRVTCCMQRVACNNVAPCMIAFIITSGYRKSYSLVWGLLRPPYTRQHVACNNCGYFDLVSNMLPEIEGCSISGNMLLTRSK